MRVATTWSELRSLTPARCDAIVASDLGWMLGAFDFFVMADQFGTDVKASPPGVSRLRRSRPQLETTPFSSSATVWRIRRESALSSTARARISAPTIDEKSRIATS